MFTFSEPRNGRITVKFGGITLGRLYILRKLGQSKKSPDKYLILDDGQFDIARNSEAFKMPRTDKVKAAEWMKKYRQTIAA